MKRYENDTLCLTIDGRKAELHARLPKAASRVQVRLHSGRNRPIARTTDVSTRKPAGCTEPDLPIRPQAVWLPTVDVRVVPAMEAIVTLDPCTGGSWALNYLLGQEAAPVTSPLHIPAASLLDWENILWLEDGNSVPVDFALAITFPQLPSMSRAFEAQWEFLTDSWYGTIHVTALDGEEAIPVGTLEIPAPVRTVQAHTKSAPALAEATLLDALSGTVGYILSSRVRSDNSPSRGGLYLFYDLDGETYRNALWPWGWGPAIRTLLDAADVPEMAARYGRQTLLDAAYAAGRASLRYIVDAPGHLADGLSTARYDPNDALYGGMRERVCLSADGGFLCGWAWVPLYEATGDERFLNAAKAYADRVEALCDRWGIPPQDYAPETGDYTAHTLDESGFGTEAFEGLYRVTGDARYQALSRRYMDLHTAKFRRADGLWQRAYYRKTDTTEDCIHMTRGLGWAMEGLLSTHRTVAGQTDAYLRQAEAMAEPLLRHQRPDGAWNFRFTEPEDAVGIGEKAVALWSLLLYRLYRFTKRPEHRAAAERALQWCIANQVRDGAAEAIGSLPGSSPQSAVVYRKWYRIACVYTSGFFGQALLEALRMAWEATD